MKTLKRNEFFDIIDGMCECGQHKSFSETWKCRLCGHEIKGVACLGGDWEAADRHILRHLSVLLEGELKNENKKTNRIRK